MQRMREAGSCKRTSAFFEEGDIDMRRPHDQRTGKIKYALLGWLIGLPLPIVLILLFVRGCDF
jgi:hypothetical protein